MNRRNLAFLSGPLLFLIFYCMPTPEGMLESAKLTAGIALWIAIWWITEPVHLAVTSLLPLVLFPLTGVMSIKLTSAEYGSDIIYLFLAGFIFGGAIEKWNLHKRIALNMVYRSGSNPEKMVLGFMAASAFISMWISNTATAVMMTPVAAAIAGAKGAEGKDANFSKALLLGVCYACSIGGMGTLVGTPTNGIFVNFVQQNLGISISFWKWFVVGFPYAVVLLVACWYLLIRLFPMEKQIVHAADREKLKGELQSLGALTTPEKVLLFTFGAVILAWVSGSLLWYDQTCHCKDLNIISGADGYAVKEKTVNCFNDTVVAITGAILLFILPSGTSKNKPIMDWKTAKNLPWAVILLFGGGLALAKGFDQSGLAQWLGHQMISLKSLPTLGIVLCILLLVVVLSEVASNIATASMMMPVLASLSTALGTEPLGMLMMATLAASIGFGLPIATAPNSIVYSSGYLTTRDMAKAGFLLDIIAIGLLLLFINFVVPLVW